MRIGISFPVGLGLPRLFIDPEIEIPDPPPRPAPEEPEMSYDDLLPDQLRPNPLRDAANKVAKFWGLLAALVGMASSFGMITLAQEEAVLALGDQLKPTVLIVGALVGGLLPLVSNVIGAFKTATRARPEVTPVDDPRIWDEHDERLVRLVPLRVSGRAGRHAREDTL